MIKIDADKKKEKVQTAVLSTTTKAQARKQRKEGKAPGEPESPKPKDAEMTNEEGKKEGEEDKEKKEEDKKDEPEPDFQELKNPSRILKKQEEKITYPAEGRYIPILESRFGGFVVLREQNPSDELEYYYDEERDADAPNPDQFSEFKLPEPFEFDPAIQNA